MTLHHGDCLDVMAAMQPESVDAIVTDPPYGLEFMGKEWDRLGDVGKTSHSGTGTSDGTTAREAVYGRLTVSYSGSSNVKCRNCGKWQWDHVGRKCECERPDFPNVKAHQGRLMQEWHARWAEAAYRVAKPSAYLLAFGGTRTVHRMTVALEDAGWIIRDMLVWGYASGFPKSKASLKPAWEPIVMARKPGPLRMLAIDECRIGTTVETWPTSRSYAPGQIVPGGVGKTEVTGPAPAGRWPANIVLTDPIFDGGWEGVVGGGEASVSPSDITTPNRTTDREGWSGLPYNERVFGYGDSGTYSRFFIIPKADRADREPVLGGLPETPRQAKYGSVQDARPHTPEGYEYHRKPRANVHPTVKPTDLMRHLVRLVTPTGGVVLDPFLGSGTTALAAELEGFDWIGIEREAEYVAIAEARLNGTQRGLGLGA